jgi:hypothetical protein
LDPSSLGEPLAESEVDALEDWRTAGFVSMGAGISAIGRKGSVGDSSVEGEGCSE